MNGEIWVCDNFFDADMAEDMLANNIIHANIYVSIHTRKFYVCEQELPADEFILIR